MKTFILMIGYGVLVGAVLAVCEFIYRTILTLAY